jgi:hypothetical protein
LITWLIFFLILQTKPSFCHLFNWSLGRTFLPFCFNLCTVFWKVYQLIYFLPFKVAKWAVPSLTHSSNPFRGLYICLFQYSLFKYCSSRIFSDIDRNYLLGNRKKTAKFLMRTFTCRSTFLYAFSLHNISPLIFPYTNIKPSLARRSRDVYTAYVQYTTFLKLNIYLSRS